MAEVVAQVGAGNGAHHYEGSTIETIESVVIAFILAFVFRAFVVEAFVIPTGSMAPTLLGQHLGLTCPSCGYRFALGPDRRDPVSRGGQHFAKTNQTDIRTSCPMCDYKLEYPQIRCDAGDRILVLKYIYGLREPRRWDVVVFKNPNEPDVNYIKRLTGLPGEELRIVGGNIFTRPAGSPADAPWQIQRKTHRPSVQREVWQPVYHSDFAPLDGGDAAFRDQKWIQPWTPDDAAWEPLRGPAWRLEDTGGRGGTLTFNFAGNDHYSQNFFAYNLLQGRDRYVSPEQHPISEMRLAATVAPLGDSPVQASLLTSSINTLIRGSVNADGSVVIESAAMDKPEDSLAPAGKLAWTLRAKGQTAPLRAGKNSHLELWHADQSVSFWIDGQLVAGPWEYELKDVGLDLEELARADSTRLSPRAEIALRGSAVVRSAQLDRDLYYAQDGRGSAGNPVKIPADHFFCMGDNSPDSEDGRKWREIDPWVSSLRSTPPGFVPRELMMGRAFFVYFPATYPLGPIPYGVPNFGDMRFIR